MFIKQLFSLSTSIISHRPTVIRTMATAAPKFEWLIMVPDHPNVLDKRLEARQYVTSTPIKFDTYLVMTIID